MVRFSPEHSHHHRHSPLDRLDARARIVCAVVLSFGIALSSSLMTAGLGLLLGFLIGFTANLPLVKTIRRLLGIGLFLAVVVLPLPFTVSGQAAFSLFGLTATIEGLERATLILIKMNAVLLVILSLVGGLDAPNLGRALYKLKVPDGLVHILLFTVRYLDVLGEEQRRLRTAMRARCFRAKTSLHSYRSLGYLLGMVFIRALDRSERILQAMKCRGFHGHFHVMAEGRWAALDSITVILAFLFAGGLIVIGSVGL